MKARVLVTLLALGSLVPLSAGTVRGRVTDTENGEPLVGANVLITGSALTSPTGAATDLEGNYLITNLPAGSYQLKVSYIGYREVSRSVKVAADGTSVVHFQVSSGAVEYDAYVVTASRRIEKVQDAPAAISVITERIIRQESNTNLGDYMKSIKGVDFTQSGVDSYNLSARGFNTSFSSRLLTLTDGRMANVPSLRLIAYNVIPVTADDVHQIEVVLGPSSATYGPNAHSGVLNIVTKPPRTSEPLVFNVQRGTRDMMKIAGRAAQTWGDFGAKLSASYLTATDWTHFNVQEWRGHHFVTEGNSDLSHNRVDAIWQAGYVEPGSPSASELIPDPWPDDPSRGLTSAFLDSLGINWTEQGGQYYATVAAADGLDNDGNSDDYHDANSNGQPDAGEPGVNASGIVYSDGKDNNHNGWIDEDVDEGIDDLNEEWYDGYDNDNDGNVDEADERGSQLGERIGEVGGNKFGPYIFSSNGTMLFDTNEDGRFGGDQDVQVYSYPVGDSNGDELDDLPDFAVRNALADFRLDWDPSRDAKMSLAYGYAWAKNINLTGIARYLADGWIYRYGQARLTYKNWFAQAYLNTSFAGNTRSLSTGGRIKDTSKSFSAQIQNHKTFFGDRQRIVWGLDYFLTLPQTYGTILRDNNLWDRIDNDGDGENGSPTDWSERIDNEMYDSGEGFVEWATEGESFDDLDEDGQRDDGESFTDANGNGSYDRPGSQHGVVIGNADEARGAIADGVDNDGDGRIDEGIDEKNEDNRNATNELGLYIQSNTKLSNRWQLILANRWDVHEQLTDLIDFDSEHRTRNPFRWSLDLSKTGGLQVSPKIGIQYQPSEHQNFRVTYAKAFNTPSSQGLFLDIFVQRFSIFKVYARGAANGYTYPRDSNGNLLFWNISGTTFGVDSLGMEAFTDQNGNAAWDFSDGSNGYESDGRFSYSDWGVDGTSADPFEDCGFDRLCPGDGGYVQPDAGEGDGACNACFFPGLPVGESFSDDNGDNRYTAPDLNGTEGNGMFEEGEPSEGHEVWMDENGNGMWDELYKLMFPSADPTVRGSFSYDIPNDPEPIRAEIVRTWEVGYKGKIGRPLYATLDVFYSRYSDFVSPILFLTPLVVPNDSSLTIDRFFNAPTSYIQGIVLLEDPSGIKGNPPVVVGYLNYGKVEMWGADASLTLFLKRNLFFDTNYSFLSMSDFQNPLTGAVEPINAPRNKWSLKGTYEWPNGATVSAHLRHVDRFLWKAGIFAGTIPSYNILDVHIGYSVSKNLKLWLTLNNALDDRHTEIVGGPRLGRMVVARIQGIL